MLAVRPTVAHEALHRHGARRSPQPSRRTRTPRRSRRPRHLPRAGHRIEAQRPRRATARGNRAARRPHRPPRPRCARPTRSRRRNLPRSTWPRDARRQCLRVLPTAAACPSPVQGRQGREKSSAPPSRVRRLRAPEPDQKIRNRTISRSFSSPTGTGQAHRPAPIAGRPTQRPTPTLAPRRRPRRTTRGKRSAQHDDRPTGSEPSQGHRKRAARWSDPRARPLEADSRGLGPGPGPTGTACLRSCLPTVHSGRGAGPG